MTGTYLLGCPLVFLGKSKICSYQAALHYMNYYGPPPMDPPAPQGSIDGTGGESASALEQKAFEPQGPDASLVDYGGIKMFTPHASTGLESVEEVAPHRVVLNAGIQGPAWTSPSDVPGTTWRWYFGPLDSDTGKVKSHERPLSPLLHTKGQCGTENASLINIPEDVDEFEIVVKNLTPSGHVIHLHGHYFRVVNVANYEFVNNPFGD